MRDAAPDYLELMLEKIVGLEVEISRLEGKRKLGQNRDVRDLEGAVNALQERGYNDLASAMAGAVLPAKAP